MQDVVNCNMEIKFREKSAKLQVIVKIISQCLESGLPSKIDGWLREQSV